MRSALHFSSIILVYYPLCFIGLYMGGVWPIIMLVVLSGLLILVDWTTSDPVIRPQQYKSSTQYLLLYLHIPCALFAMGLLIWSLNQLDSSNQLAFLFQILSHGLLLGFLLAGNSIAGHELIHKRFSPFNLEMGRLLLAIHWDSQFAISHVFGHHRDVALPSDPSTARRGETIYHFFWRSSLGQYRIAYQHENKLNRSLWSGHNELSRGILYSIVLYVPVFLLATPAALISIFIALVFAKLLLETTNYIQHYGLVRSLNEKVSTRHSWACFRRGSHYGLYALSQHPHHHQNMTLEYWKLENRSARGIPNLNIGYMAAICLALIPPAWFRYIRPKLEAWDQFADTGEKPMVACN